MRPLRTAQARRMLTFLSTGKYPPCRGGVKGLVRGFFITKLANDSKFGIMRETQFACGSEYFLAESIWKAVGLMKIKNISRILCGLVAAALLIATAPVANAANIYAELATSPVMLTVVSAQNAAEVGKYEYVYDIKLDNESQFDEFQFEGFDMSKIVNENEFSHGSTTGMLTQKWDGYAASTGIKSWDQEAYGSYNSGGSWTIPALYTGLGQGILNPWHHPSDYQGTSSSGVVDPKFIAPGHIVADSTGAADAALRFVNSVTTSTLYNGLIATVRIVHPNKPDVINFRGYSFNAPVYTNTLLGPSGAGPSPEPGTIALLGIGLLGMTAVIRRRRNV